MTQLFLKSFAYLAAIVLMFATTSCDTVLQYPEGEGIDPTLIKTRVELAVDFTPINDPLLASYAEARTGDFDVRYQVAIYAVSGAQAGKMVERKVWTSNVLEAGPTTVTTDVDLHAERYEIYAWIDFVPSGTTDDYHYITDEPSTVYLSDPNVHALDTRDAFSAKMPIDLTAYRDKKFAEVTIPVTMERPFGKFKIITTDVKKYLDTYRPIGTYADIMPSVATVTYTCYFPTAYNLDTRLAHVENFTLGVNHSNEVTDIEENNAVLSSNYIFICTDNTVVTAEIEVKNSSGDVLARVGNITIPIQRNKNTIITGEFLTAGVSGGTVIAPDFDGDMNVPI